MGIHFPSGLDFPVVVLGSYPVILRADSWLSTQESVLAGLSRPFGMPGTEPRLGMHVRTASSLLPSCSSPLPLFLKKQMRDPEGKLASEACPQQWNHPCPFDFEDKLNSKQFMTEIPGSYCLECRTIISASANHLFRQLLENVLNSMLSTCCSLIPLIIILQLVIKTCTWDLWFECSVSQREWTGLGCWMLNTSCLGLGSPLSTTGEQHCFENFQPTRKLNTVFGGLEPIFDFIVCLIDGFHSGQENEVNFSTGSLYLQTVNPDCTSLLIISRSSDF